MSTPPKILCITKNFPPQLGGIEKYCEDTFFNLTKEGCFLLVIKASPRNQYLLSRKNKKLYYILYLFSEFLRLFYFFSKCCTIGIYYSFQVELIWSMDGSIGFIGLFLSFISSKKNRVTLHGLDVSYDNFFYQKLLGFVIARTDEIYVVSRTILNRISHFLIPNQKVLITEHSFQNLHFADPDSFSVNNFFKKYNLPDKILLFSIGRFVEKKGFHWFLNEVFPYIDKNKFHYILSGFGEMEDDYLKIIRDKKIDNITLTGAIFDAAEKAKLYSIANYLVMPNIKVNNDCEGFGIVLLEAQYYKLQILASRVDGIDDRVGDCGVSLDPNPEIWIKYLQSLSLSFNKKSHRPKIKHAYTKQEEL